MRTLYALLPLLSAACAYDWQIGQAPGDGGEGGDAGTLGGHDAGADVSADAPADATPDARPDCAALLADLDTSRAAAKACTLGLVGQCMTSIEDECDCASYVREAGSAATMAYAAAIASVRAAGCSVACPPCLVSVGACLFTGSTEATCTP